MALPEKSYYQFASSQREEPNAVHKQYELWPYPSVPILAKLNSEDLWQLSLTWLRHQMGVAQSGERPKILIVGAGTFQPFAMASANPTADILATDISQQSLQIARRRCQWHRQSRVKFEIWDANRIEDAPTDRYDLIECYGVLMNLRNPTEVLQKLSSLLTPNGILRLMVYPYFGRQRIFQIQRLASLLNLTAFNQRHPDLLRDTIFDLPKENPLKHTFANYSDATNNSGIVDGFMHLGDRAFTGFEVSSLLHSANLNPRFFYHRPWGSPVRIAEKFEMNELSLGHRLHFLDAWGILKTNYIIAATKNEAGVFKEELHQHPLFRPTLSRPMHALRMLRGCLFGVTLQSRTHADGKINVSVQEMRDLIRGRKLPQAMVNQCELDKLLEIANIENKNNTDLPRSLFAFDSQNPQQNPLYHHHFEAFHWQYTHKNMLSPFSSSFEEKMISENAELEDASCPFGLTPFVSYKQNKELFRSLVESQKPRSLGNFSNIKFTNDENKIDVVHRFLKHLVTFPHKLFSESDMRELWILLFSYPSATLEIDGAVE